MNLKFLALVALLMVKILAAPIVYVDFKIHQEQLAKVACVDRNAPITVCRANCVLVSKLQLTADASDEEKNLKGERHQEILYFSNFPVFQFFSKVPIIKMAWGKGIPCKGFDHRPIKPPNIFL
ncbi:hypothetical protein [Echinicola vietnamensis]|uniref:Uncharacterized protein n=1 Tax=Echinicola vietnamensis (strain DSM 17526 / LMG 23754 / KMM 6221) TaxID=926556 RepID=L0G3X0_ECHVK|nr:hypothetical protein [Echinicola vietnamensis]AGA80232.1 hypothetical protein Echvi_4025 [Echinicola vietnamensis DSM 17526]